MQSSSLDLVTFLAWNIAGSTRQQHKELRGKKEEVEMHPVS
jgi:hypothetical protein